MLLGHLNYIFISHKGHARRRKLRSSDGRASGRGGFRRKGGEWVDRGQVQKKSADL